MKKTILMLVLGALVATAQATLYLYDGFSNTADTRLGANASSGGSNGWNTVGSNPSPTNRTGTLTYSGLPTSTGGKVELAGYRSGASGGANLKLWDGTVANQNTNMFASFLLNVASIGTSQSNNDKNVLFTLRATKASLVVSNNATVSGNYNIGIVVGSGAIYWDLNGGNGYVAGTTYLLVFSYTNNATGSWSDQLWVNPVLGQDSPGAAQLTTGAFSGSTATNNTISFGNANGITDSAQRAQIYVDELRVGTTWADVTPIPEPATIGMLGLGALTTMMIRRIRQS